MNVLGLSFDYHDAAAALLVKGEIVAAAEEERFSRKKHDASYPARAVAFCLEQAGIGAGELDAVVFYEFPFLKFERILDRAIRTFPKSLGYIKKASESWFRTDKFDVAARISADLGIGRDKIHFVRHHASHAAAAFYCSPFEEATIVTLDGAGEFETATMGLGDAQGLRVLNRFCYPHSVGLFYSAMTAFLGFEVNEGEYKVMGMAGFGRPTQTDKIRKLVRYSGKRFRVDLSYFNFDTPADSFAKPKLNELLGTPRIPESPFDVGDPALPEVDDPVQTSSRHYADIAASLQRVTEDIILEIVKDAVMETGIRNVVLAGGVALNSLANGRIIRELGYPLYVHPAAGDAGGALGAALHHYVCTHRQPRPKPLTRAFLGKGYDDALIRDTLERSAVSSVSYVDDDEELLARTAKLLQDGHVVGWFQDRFEWGPRALGARSILGNPAISGMRRTINEKIKFREPFRPFAPAVLAERAADFFEMDAPKTLSQPENFMLAVHRVRPEMQAVIPSVTHVDGTARVQLLWPDQNRFRKLVEAFDRLTGIPVILNTSFNRRGEPIVASPQDALTTFSWSGMDYLVMSNFIIGKDVL
ncbi:MAG: hypothetical protein HQL44_13890 [Alphaproteobacteria bacterium]|nr:hypothetical protein [Alphaproteobacteria bacterium]